jgi:hypothetical protein
MSWALPAGWVQKPNEEMRVASFAVKAKDGEEGDVAIIPLPGMQGKEGDLVNMWREQVNLPPGDARELGGKFKEVSVGGKTGKLFEIGGAQPVASGKSPAMILVAMLTEGEQCWFFKLAGPEGLVSGEKPAFLKFLQSISFGATPGAGEFVGKPHEISTNVKDVPEEASQDLPGWTVPKTWTAATPGPMLAAKFTVSGGGAAKADVNISQSAGMGGGVLMNINRWRGQLKLEPVDEGALSRLATTLDAAGSKVMLVDMSGTNARSGAPARIVGAIVPLGGQTWFYKLMGDSSVVEQEKAAFVDFVKTAKYANAP